MCSPVPLKPKEHQDGDGNPGRVAVRDEQPEEAGPACALKRSLVERGFTKSTSSEIFFGGHLGAQTFLLFPPWNAARGLALRPIDIPPS